MSDILLIGTRKGLFTLERQGNGWSIIRTAFLADPVSVVLPDPRDGSMYAALALGHFGVKLHRSLDGGITWEECQAPAFPGQPAPSVPGSEPEPGQNGDSVAQIWALETGGVDEPGVLWAGTAPAALFRSTDRGSSWTLVESLWDREERKGWFGGGTDLPALHSVCVHPLDSRQITVAISLGGVWHTADGAQSWEPRAKGMRADYMPPDQAYEQNVQDPHHLVQCPAAPNILWAQHHNGIFRSTDGALTWEDVPNVQPSAFGFTVAVHPDDPDTAWFVPAVKDELRIPVNGQLVVTRTRDGGKSFDILREGLPQQHAYDLVYRHGMDVDDTGTRLAFGSTTGSAWISENQGDTWTCLSNHLPPINCVRFLGKRLHLDNVEK
ncbi:MAG: WD40/YVTN/BNR-like repeat-containing protein [Chloroflexota bacterium]